MQLKKLVVFKKHSFQKLNYFLCRYYLLLSSHWAAVASILADPRDCNWHEDIKIKCARQSKEPYSVYVTLIFWDF